MSYCLNPDCQKPQNAEGTKFCQTCGSKLLLKERYRGIKLIGQGGFGRTFLSIDEDKPSKPHCVIKQFFPQAQGTSNTQKAAELFEQEAVRLDELGKHPQIPELLAHFTQDNRQYLVQEFIDGQNLDLLLEAEGAFSESQIRDLLNSLLPVLEFIHSHNVIHRDIKPANIILRSDGNLVLVDFGAAKYATGTALLKTGTTIGTPEYMAPEQFKGKAVFASDLYSLGVTCLNLLTMVSPFKLMDLSENTWVWRHYLSDNSISNELGQILDKLTENATNKRYRLAEEVLKDLHSQQEVQESNQELYKQGIANAQCGNYREAIKNFSQALSVNQNDAIAYRYRGQAHFRLGENQAAIADFQKAADLYLQQRNTNYYQDALNRISAIKISELKPQTPIPSPHQTPPSVSPQYRKESISLTQPSLTNTGGTIRKVHPLSSIQVPPGWPSDEKVLKEISAAALNYYACLLEDKIHEMNEYIQQIQIGNYSAESQLLLNWKEVINIDLKTNKQVPFGWPTDQEILATLRPSVLNYYACQLEDKIKNMREYIERLQTRCPQCGSAQLDFRKKSFSWGKATAAATAGAMFLGPMGLLGGLIGFTENDVEISCLQCGHRWKQIKN